MDNASVRLPGALAQHPAMGPHGAPPSADVMVEITTAAGTEDSGVGVQVCPWMDVGLRIVSNLAET